MQMHEIAKGVLAFVHPGGRSSCGMVHSTEGIVLVDTTARPIDIQACLQSAQAPSEDVCLVLITHSHNDHTSGIPIFDCPVLLTSSLAKEFGIGACNGRGVSCQVRSLKIEMCRKSAVCSWR